MLIYASIIKGVKIVIWLHSARVTYPPQRVTMMGYSSWVKRAAAFCVFRAEDRVCTERGTAAGTVYASHGMARARPLTPRLALPLGLGDSNPGSLSVVSVTRSPKRNDFLNYQQHLLLISNDRHCHGPMIQMTPFYLSSGCQ